MNRAIFVLSVLELAGSVRTEIGDDEQFCL